MTKAISWKKRISQKSPLPPHHQSDTIAPMKQRSYHFCSAATRAACALLQGISFGCSQIFLKQSCNSGGTWDYTFYGTLLTGRANCFIINSHTNAYALKSQLIGGTVSDPVDDLGAAFKGIFFVETV
jgi:hypothetical protein